MSWMETMFDKGYMGFDCASMHEITTVRKFTKLAPILYAQPCKTLQDIDTCVRHGIRATVVDSPEEMSKLANAGWKSDVLIRLMVPDSNSKQPFSRKFGAPLEWIPEIINIAKNSKIKVSGFSFHVGSECENPEQFSKALHVCRLAMDQAVFTCAYDARKLNTIDIGGGFLPTESNISHVSQVLAHSREQYFPEATSHKINWIAEPGRFMSATCQTLYTPVIGRKRGLPSKTPDAPEYRYTLHESVYGYFSNIPFDGQKPEFKVAYTREQNAESRHKSILFGRTCDGADIINPNVNLPLLHEGDWLEVDNMGSYTNVTASEFNGFPKPDVIYLQ